MVALCAALTASVAQAMVYMWKDATGTAHYTNKEYDIPVRYKTKAKALYPDASDSGQNQAKNAPNQVTPPVQAQPAIVPQVMQNIPRAAKTEQPGVLPKKALSRGAEVKPRRGQVHRSEEED